MPCLALLLALAFSPPQKPRELFQNGGFESGVDGWRTLDMSQGAAFVIDDKVKQSGKQSLRFEKKGSGRPDFLKQSADLSVHAGKVAVSLACRVEKDTRPVLEFYFFDAKDETIGKGFVSLGTPKSSKSFEVLKQELEIPKGAKGCGLNVHLDQPGTVWIDDVSVTIAADPKKSAAKKGPGPMLDPMLLNGGFDVDLDSWIEEKCGSGTCEASIDPKTKCAGAGALRLARKSPRLFPEDAWSSAIDDIDKPGRYTLDFQARVSGAARGALVLQALDARGVALATARMDVASSGETFAPGAVSIDAPQGTTSLSVTLMIQGSGDLWFDALKIGRK